MAANYVEKIYELVKKSKIKDALELGIKTAESINPSVRSEWTVLKNQFDKLKRSERLGILTYSEVTRELAKIALAILELSKELETATPNSPKPSSGNTILFLASDSSEEARLKLEQEFAQISYKLQNSNFPFQLKSEWAVTSDKLQGALLDHKPRIVHFSGHGLSPKGQAKKEGTRVLKSRASKFSGGIVLNDREVDGKILKNLFAIFADYFPVEVVVMNACYSAIQAEAIHSYVPYVIGMKEAIHDDDAVAFSSSFYQTLASENNVELAFRLACHQIDLSGGSGDHIPILHGKK